MTIIDLHSHWGTRRGYPLRTPEALALQKRTWNSEPAYDTEQEMADYLRACDVQAVLDFGFTRELGIEEVRELHDYGLAVRAEHPDAVLGLWLNMDPRGGEPVVEELRRCLEADCFIGLSISGAAQGLPATDPVWEPLLEVCTQARAPVLVLVGHNGGGAGLPGGGGMILDHAHPRYVDALAATHPELCIVAGRPAWPWQTEMISVLLHKPNVCNELHGWSPKYLTPEFVHEIGGRLRTRIMFGADYPLLRYERLIADWRGLGLDDEVYEAIFHGNARELLSRLRPITGLRDR